MKGKYLRVLLLACAVAGFSGCPHGGNEYDQGKKAEALQDYDTALIHYNRALMADPLNPEYKLKATRLRYEAAQYHVEQGLKLGQMGNLQMALAEFQKAMLIDPASAIAQQEAQTTLDNLAAQAAQKNPPKPQEPEEAKPMAGPPELKPLSRAPINLKMANDAKMVYDTVAKLAGLTVIFDPDFTSRRVSVDLTNVTLEQALDIVSWSPKPSGSRPPATSFSWRRIKRRSGATTRKRSSVRST